MVARGLQEQKKPLADTPTACREPFRLFISLPANKDFSIKALDVSTAFLQSMPLQRTIFMVPPQEAESVGKLWKLKKACYGLVYNSLQFYWSVKEETKKFKMKSFCTDDAFYYKHDQDGNLEGIALIHVDDFLVLRTNQFLKEISQHLKGRFELGSSKEHQFTYTGVNIRQD